MSGPKGTIVSKELTGKYKIRCSIFGKAILEVVEEQMVYYGIGNSRFEQVLRDAQHKDMKNPKFTPMSNELRIEHELYARRNLFGKIVLYRRIRYDCDIFFEAVPYNRIPLKLKGIS